MQPIKSYKNSIVIIIGIVLFFNIVQSQSIFFSDLHNDFAYRLFVERYNYSQFQVTPEKIKRGHIGIIVYSIWVDSKSLKGKYKGKLKQYNYKPFQMAIAIIKNLKRFLSHYKHINIVYNKTQFQKTISKRKAAAILSLEGFHVIKNFYQFQKLYKEGIRIWGLTWMINNKFFESSTDKHIYKNGLSLYGKALLVRIAQYQPIIDISHSSDELAWFMLKHTKFPILATHSSMRFIKYRLRNLSSKLVKAICHRKGIIGINFHSPYLTTKRRASIQDIIKHIINGYKYGKCVAIGSDFDGYIKVPKDIKDISKYPILYKRLSQMTTTKIAQKIMWQNTYNFFLNNLPDK